MVHKEPQETKDQQDLQAMRALQDNQDRMDHPVIRVHKDLKVQQVAQDLPVLPEQQVTRVLPAHQVPKDNQAAQDLMEELVRLVQQELPVLQVLWVQLVQKDPQVL